MDTQLIMINLMYICKCRINRHSRYKFYQINFNECITNVLMVERIFTMKSFACSNNCLWMFITDKITNLNTENYQRETKPFAQIIASQKSLT